MTNGEVVHAAQPAETAFEEALADLELALQSATEAAFWVSLGRDVPADSSIIQVPLSALVTVPDLYQNRTEWPGGISPDHVNELAEALALGAEIAPMEVIFGGAALVVINGHHRLAAHQSFAPDPDTAVWVLYRALTPREALLVAGLDNAQTRLPMNRLERMEYAWRMVRQDHLGLVRLKERQISARAGVAVRQVQVMRRKIRDGADLNASWRAVLASGRDASTQSGEEIQAKRESDADGLWLAMTRSTKFGHYARKDPEIIALALERNMPGSAVRVAAILQEYFLADVMEGNF